MTENSPLVNHTFHSIKKFILQLSKAISMSYEILNTSHSNLPNLRKLSMKSIPNITEDFPLSLEIKFLVKSPTQYVKN